MGFTTCGPDAALVKSGYGLSQPTIVAGGYVFNFPCLQRVERIDLRIMTLDINSPVVYTKQGVPISVNSIAQVKISQKPDLLRVACGNFLGMPRASIGRAAEHTLEGHQRAILGTLTVEEVFQDREKFASEVTETAAPDITAMGMEIISFTIKDVFDSEGYLNSLGKKRTAEVKRDARIGEAEAERDAGVREAEANREKMSRRYDAEITIADAQRKFQLQKAAFDNEVNAEVAKANLAKELQVAKTRQEIKKEALEVEVVVRKKRIEIEEQEITRRSKELEASVKKPAEAERYRMETIADGARNARFVEADAGAQATVLKGQAEAHVIKAVGEAEAGRMALKADAWKEYPPGAYIEMLVQKLPELVTEVATPLSQAKDVMFISTGGEEIGAARLTNEVAKVVGQLPQIIEGVTGINITQAMQRRQISS